MVCKRRIAAVARRRSYDKCVYLIADQCYSMTPLIDQELERIDRCVPQSFSVVSFKLILYFISGNNHLTAFC